MKNRVVYSGLVYLVALLPLTVMAQNNLVHLGTHEDGRLATQRSDGVSLAGSPVTYGDMNRDGVDDFAIGYPSAATDQPNTGYVRLYDGVTL